MHLLKQFLSQFYFIFLDPKQYWHISKEAKLSQKFYVDSAVSIWFKTKRRFHQTGIDLKFWINKIYILTKSIQNVCQLQWQVVKSHKVVNWQVLNYFCVTFSIWKLCLARKLFPSEIIFSLFVYIHFPSISENNLKIVLTVKL